MILLSKDGLLIVFVKSILQRTGTKSVQRLLNGFKKHSSMDRRHGLGIPEQQNWKIKR